MKLLLIEDDEMLGDALVRGLKKKKHVVDWVTDGSEGFDLACDERYDVLIVDWMLPSLSGPDLLEQLRAAPDAVNRHTPALVLTARLATPDVVHGLESGADDYLTKPFDFSELLARIAALSRRQPQFSSSKIAVGDLELETTTQTVYRAGQRVEVSQREYALLEFLVRQSPRYFSAQQLTERVWQFDSDVTANAAQVYIGYLRKKIDTAFPNLPPLLVTKRGFGYALQSPTTTSKKGSTVSA